MTEAEAVLLLIDSFPGVTVVRVRDEVVKRVIYLATQRDRERRGG